MGIGGRPLDLSRSVGMGGDEIEGGRYVAAFVGKRTTGAEFRDQYEPACLLASLVILEGLDRLDLSRDRTGTRAGGEGGESSPNRSSRSREYGRFIVIEGYCRFQ